MKIVSGFPGEITVEDVFKRLIQMGPKAPFQNMGPRTRKDIERLIRESEGLVRPRAVYEIFPCRAEKGILFLGKGKIAGDLPAKVFGASGKVGLFIATIGKELEEKEKYYSGRRELPIIDAIGSAAASRWAIYLHHQIIDPCLDPGGNIVTARLYPGVGGWPESEQKTIFRIFGEKAVEDAIGVRLTAGNMMLPRKSISAIVGVKTRSS